MQKRRVMLEIVAVGHISMIYLASAVKVLEFVRVEVSDLQNGDSQSKRQKDKQKDDYARRYFCFLICDF